MPAPADYNEVADRIREFREKHPEGSLQQVDLRFIDFAGKSWVVYTAAAYRSKDDTKPGHGTAWEPVPGPTNFTKDSEVQNAETSAWGRAIVAALAADTKKGIASADEVRNRAQAPKPPRQQRKPANNGERPADDTPPFDKPGTITDSQMAAISAGLVGDDAPDTLAKILTWAKVERLEDLSSSQADVVIGRMKVAA